MNGLRLSQESVACNAILPGKTRNIEMLLNMAADAEVDRELLEHVRRYLVKVSEEVGELRQEVNHELLQRVFKCLQTWALSPLLGKLLEMGIVYNLAIIYDNFMQADHSRSELMTSTIELLFVVEDMSDSTEGKLHCGKFFLLRLLGLATATAKSPSVKLQRAAVETICALITRSPENQQAVLEQKAECCKLFKLFLPRCGDFQLQGSITEIFYRLVKRGPHLLEFLQDAAVRKSMESLMQSKQPALLTEIRKIVTLLNESLGPVRSVYSFLAEGIIINGHKMNTTDKWVNFGRAQLSFFIVGLPEQNIDESSMITDVQYKDIVEIKNACPGPASLLEILVQEGAGLSSFKALQLESGLSTVVHLQMYFNHADLSTIEASVLPKIRSNSMAPLVGRQGIGANTPFVDKRTNKGWKGGGPVHCKIIQPTRLLRSRPSNKMSPAGDDRLLEWTESRRPNEKCGFGYIPTSTDLAFESQQDPETLKGAANAPHQSLTTVEARSARNQIFNGIISDGQNLSCIAPGKREEEYRCQPRVAAVTSTFEHINLRKTDRQLFPRTQEHHQLHDNILPTEVYQKTSLRPPIDNQADINQPRTVPTAVRHVHANCDNRRTSKPSQLKTHNLQDPSGPKTKSPSDANLRPGVSETDDDTTHETNNSERGGELRMKKRQDLQHTNIVALESPHHLCKVRNICHQVSNAEVQEARKSAESSERNLMTPPKDMLASDSVMTDIREKPVTGGKGTHNYRRRPSRTVLNSATATGGNGEKNASRPLRKRTCKKPTIYFDADDDLTSSASDSSQEFVVTRQKVSSGMVMDPAIDKNAPRRRAQTVSNCQRRAAAREENKGSTACRRNCPMPDKQPRGMTALTLSVSRKQNYSTKRWANYERKVASASNSKKNGVEDVFCFTTDPAEERQTRKSSLSLSSKANQYSDYAEPQSKRRKKPTVQSHDLLGIARQRFCISDGPRLVIPVRQPAKVVKSPPTGSPKQDKGSTPHQQEPGSLGLSSDSDDHDRSPVLQARKTYTKSEKIITKHSRLERWKSFSIRKLELPTLDATSQEESSDGAKRRSSPYAKETEVEDVVSDSEDSSGIGIIAKLLENFKQKVKLVEKKSIGDVLSNTMQRIQNEIQSVEERVRGEKMELLDACNKRCGRLDSQLKEQITKIRTLYDKFKLDFSQHIERHNVIVGEIEDTELQLNDLAKQQGQDHKDVLNKLKESCKHLLAAADQSVLGLGKGSTGMRGLRAALQGILKDL